MDFPLAWLGTYASRHPETRALTNITVILNAENTVQPDALLRHLPEHGGLTRVSEDGYVTCLRVRVWKTD